MSQNMLGEIEKKIKQVKIFKKQNTSSYVAKSVTACHLGHYINYKKVQDSLFAVNQ